jgi:hypothetical protein
MQSRARIPPKLAHHCGARGALSKLASRIALCVKQPYNGDHAVGSITPAQTRYFAGPVSETARVTNENPHDRSVFIVCSAGWPDAAIGLTAAK